MEKKLQVILKDYSPKDVYNADKTGLFCLAMPNRTFALKSDQCTGKKTILFCVNNMGDEKKNPLIIKKSMDDVRYYDFVAEKN